jgi:hypothetical protein
MSEHPTAEQENETTTTQIAVPQDQKDSVIDDMSKFLAEFFEDTFALLVERRDGAYKVAVKPLDEEQTQLAEESASIAEAAQNLEALLPAKVREAQRQADALMLDGKEEEAQAKIAEQRAAEAAPAAMDARQCELEARWHEIEDEKEVVARRVAEAWWGECQKITRAVEHGYFITLLDGLKQSLSEFKQRTGTVALDSRFQDIRIHALTADAGSEEWSSGCGWYKVW